MPLTITPPIGQNILVKARFERWFDEFSKLDKETRFEEAPVWIDSMNKILKG